ncbi:MAG TPA: phenylacetate--CoA ligase [Candidatus Faecaligallichristensenella faecipullorum]|nr:phenylacetate--CoA ligase [Candidatus Faecaligallichristensenella faecipullorum]
MIWNEKIETMDREAVRAIQLERLRETMKRAYRVPFYKERMDKIGMKPEDFKTFEDLQKMPFTVKTDLRDHYPYGLFAEPMENIVRIHASSGTTGKPIVAGYTRNDLENWAECIARLITAAGARRSDIAQISFGYGLFTGALGLHYGLEKIGAAVVPISSGNTERQINLMRDFGSTVLVATPSYAMHMAEVAERMGAMKDIKLRVGLFGAEASTEEMRAKLEEKWGIIATENYGLTEVMGPGVAGECECKKGMHINEDHFFCEIINPETGEVLPEGEQGEMVITTLTKEGMPMIRYRTRDITRLITEKCACGRTSLRMEKCKGRSDDMLIIRGVNVFPSQIESVLLGIKEIGPHYEIEVDRENYMDKIEVKVELIESSLLDNFAELENLRRSIMARLRVVCQLDIPVKLVSPNTLKRFEGKAKRVVDRRKD